MANPPGFEPGPARLELAMLPLHHGLPLSFGLTKEPPAGVEPTPRPYDGRVLPFTLRRLDGDGGTRTHIDLVASEVLFQLSDVPGGRARRVLSVRMTEGGRPGSNRYRE